MTAPSPAALIARAEQLLQSEAAKSRKDAERRRRSAEVWRSSLVASDDDMANVVATRPISNRVWARIEKEREESAERDDRIALRDDARAKEFEAAAQSVAALAQALQQVEAKLDAIESRLSSTADLLNTELRANYAAAYEVTPEGDWREAIQRLVDGVRHGCQYHAEGEVRRLTEERDKLKAESETWQSLAIQPVGGPALTQRALMAERQLGIIADLLRRVNDGHEHLAPNILNVLISAAKIGTPAGKA